MAMSDTLCDACAEPLGEGPRCVHCGERINQDDETEDSRGFGGDSIAVAALCAVATASLILWVLV